MSKRLLSRRELLSPLPRRVLSLPGLTMVALMLILGISLTEPEMVAYASQPDASLYVSQQQASLNQTDRWHVSGDGTWYLFNEQRTGDVVNSWFQDFDGSWYLLAPGDGHMYAGLIHDTLTDRWYYCQTEHDGWYGRMAHANGPYTVNGRQVTLQFNQEHDGTFGAILSGLDDIRSTGIPTQDIEGIPEDVATSSSSSNSNSSSSSNSSNSASSTNTSNSTISEVHQAWLDYGYSEEEYQDKKNRGVPDEDIAKFSTCEIGYPN